MTIEEDKYDQVPRGIGQTYAHVISRFSSEGDKIYENSLRYSESRLQPGKYHIQTV
jgi:hypothetical protein